MNGPNGNMAHIPAICSLLAWGISIVSTCMCSFLSRSVTLSGPAVNGTEQITIGNQGVGFWGWASDGTCYSYEINDQSPSFDILFVIASALTTVTDALGGLVTVCCGLGTIFPIAPQQYQTMGFCTVLVAILDALTLLSMASSVCSSEFFNYVEPSIGLETFTISSCGLGLGSILAVVASFLWFACAACILTTNLSKKGRLLLVADKTKEGQDVEDAVGTQDITGFDDLERDQYQDEYNTQEDQNFHNPDDIQGMVEPLISDPHDHGQPGDHQDYRDGQQQQHDEYQQDAYYQDGNEQHRSYDDQQQPYDNQQQPYDDQQHPYDNQQQPYDDQQQPYDDQQHPYDDQQQPYDDQQQPYDNQQQQHYDDQQYYGENDNDQQYYDPHYDGQEHHESYDTSPSAAGYDYQSGQQDGYGEPAYEEHRGPDMQYNESERSKFSESDNDAEMKMNDDYRDDNQAPYAQESYKNEQYR